MDNYHYNSFLSKSLFIDSKNECNEDEDSTSDEEIDVGEEDPVPIEREYAVDSEEDDEEEETEDDEEDNTFIRKRIVPLVPPRSRQNAKPIKTVKKKRNHNTMERVRREKVSMCYAVLRSAMGEKDVSRNRSLEVATDLINKYNTRLKEVNEKIEDYENKIKSLMMKE